ncbi:MAG: glycosyltransferase [Gluconacetobacter diazotrophicus]|nr:glycosyltransferase [Gluconacetobacter diazotrophicus]
MTTAAAPVATGSGADASTSPGPGPGNGLALSVVVPCFRERPNVRPLVAALHAAFHDTLGDRSWEVVFVDDDSPDGTIDEIRALAATDPRVRGLRRIGRRGLSSAVIEGVLSSSAPLVAVMDGDLQHDETRLPLMVDALLSDRCDLVVGSRHVSGGDAAGLSSPWRHRLSNGGTSLAARFIPTRPGFAPLRDPMSGFFACRRALFERIAPRLGGQGFKILLDLVLSARSATGEALRILEVPARFRPRLAGESKLDALVLFQFAAMLLDKLCGGLLPMRFLLFAAIGLAGVAVNLLVLDLARLAGAPFGTAQTLGTVVAIATNFGLDNAVTYRDRRLRGSRFWSGLLLFGAVCAVGAVANVGIATALHDAHHPSLVSGAAGAALGVVWNYAVSSTLIWRR